MGFGRRARQIGSVHSAFVAPSLLLRSRLVSLASAIFSWRIRSDQHSAHSYELPLRWVDVLNPATNQLVTKVPQSTQQVFTLPLSSAYWRPGCYICCSYNLPSAILRKWSEQLNQQNQPFPPGPRQPPWLGSRWRRRQGCYQEGQQ